MGPLARTAKLNNLRSQTGRGLDGELAVLHKANPVSQLLAAIPGVDR
jgi:hypothetical protein